METTTLPAGCWVDGQHGRYAPARAVLLLLAAGWEPHDANTLGRLAVAYLDAMDRADALAEAHYGGEDAGSVLADAVDDGSLWADERVPAFHYAGWVDGEYGVWPVGDGPDEQ